MEHLQVVVYPKDGCDCKNDKVPHTLGCPWESPTFSSFTFPHHCLIKRNLHELKGRRENDGPARYQCCVGREVPYPVAVFSVVEPDLIYSEMS